MQSIAFRLTHRWAFSNIQLFAIIIYLRVDMHFEALEGQATDQCASAMCGNAAVAGPISEPLSDQGLGQKEHGDAATRRNRGLRRSQKRRILAGIYRQNNDA